MVQLGLWQTQATRRAMVLPVEQMVALVFRALDQASRMAVRVAVRLLLLRRGWIQSRTSS